MIIAYVKPIRALRHRDRGIHVRFSEPLFDRDLLAPLFRKARKYVKHKTSRQFGLAEARRNKWTSFLKWAGTYEPFDRQAPSESILTSLEVFNV